MINQRGGIWVGLQFLLFLAILFSPQIKSLPIPLTARYIGLFALATGLSLIFFSIIHLGKSGTPFPRPRRGAKLITTGLYRFVRHPTYASVTLAALGWSIWRSNALSLFFSFLLLIFFEFKSRLEEKWLLEMFPEYDTYLKHVKYKFIPGVY